MVKRANKQGLWVGLVACILFTAYAVLTSSKFTIDGEKQILLDLGAWNFTHHKYMLGVYSHLIVFFIGWAASYLFPAPKVDDSLTIYGYLKERKAAK